jgi:hypothetical protein
LIVASKYAGEIHEEVRRMERRKRWRSENTWETCDEDVSKSIFKKLNTSTGISLEGIALQLRTVLKIQTPWNERNFVRI